MSLAGELWLEDFDGSFRIEGVPAGAHRVVARHPGFSHSRLASGRPVLDQPIAVDIDVTVAASDESAIVLEIAPEPEGESPSG